MKDGKNATEPSSIRADFDTSIHNLLTLGEDVLVSWANEGDGRLWVRLPAVLMNINAKAKEVPDRYEMAAIAGAIRVTSAAVKVASDVSKPQERRC